MSLSPQGDWVGMIPRQRMDAVVQFYVTAVDTQGHQAAYPPQGPTSGALFRVGNALNSETGLQTVEIIVTESTESELGRSTNLMSNDLLGATVVIDGTAYYDVGVRLKGSEHGRADRNRRGYSLHFRPEELFRGVHETVGVDRSGGWRFGRTFGQDEILIHQFINRAGGVPSMYNDLAYVDGPTLGASTAMLQIARYSSVYLDEQFENGSEGTRFEYELIYTMLTSGGVESEKAAQEGPSVFGIPVGRDFGDNPEFYRHYFLIKNNMDRDDYSGMIRLAQTFGLSTSSFLDAAPDVIDVDQWLRAFAAMSLSGADDNYNAGAQHNAMFYQRPSDGKMLLFPFDMDFAFITSPTAAFSRNSDLTRLLRSPDNEHHFLGHIHDIISTSFNTEYMTSWASYYDQLLGGQSLPSIVSWIDQRATALLGRLPEATEFNIVDDQLTTDQSWVTLTGQGWINVREILSGQPGSELPLDVTWTSSTTWEARVPVATGTQDIVLTAIDFRGNEISSDSVTVTSTASNDVVGNLLVSELNYHPYPLTATEQAANSNLDAEDFEFIELLNVGDTSVQLQNARFVNGIDFVFPQFEMAPANAPSSSVMPTHLPCVTDPKFRLLASSRATG